MQCLDFSAAQRKGFIDAFVEYWLRRRSTRTEDELRVTAGRIIKGCSEHFRTGVTRIGSSSAVIPFADADSFKTMAMALLSVKTPDEFVLAASTLRSRFPSVSAWLDWWLREDNAMMLFQSQREMDPTLWNSLPATTNAEEAMHRKIYTTVGSDHELMEGLHSLVAFIGTFEQQMTALARESSSNSFVANV